MFNNIYIKRIYIVSLHGIIAGVSKDKLNLYYNFKHTYACIIKDFIQLWCGVGELL